MGLACGASVLWLVMLEVSKGSFGMANCHSSSSDARLFKLSDQMQIAI